MTRKIARLALLFAVAAALAGCDKCGNWQQPQFPGAPAKSCGPDPR